VTVPDVIGELAVLWHNNQKKSFFVSWLRTPNLITGLVGDLLFFFLSFLGNKYPTYSLDYKRVVST